MTKIKKINISVAFALVFSILMSLALFDASCADIRTRVLRLHILANSDSEYDQQLKLAVRDRLLSECGSLFAETDSIDDAIAEVKANLPALQAVAEATLADYGCSYGVKVEVAPSDFNTRDYGDVTLPAGRYEAVRVLIGNAEGQNWWCVCFPNLCIPAASQTDEIGSALSEGETKIVTSKSEYKVRFKIVEWYESIKRWFS